MEEKVIGNKILTVAFWMMSFITLILIVWFIFGRSPTTQQVLNGFISTFVLDIYRRQFSFSRKISKLVESDKWIKKSLDRIEVKL